MDVWIDKWMHKRMDSKIEGEQQLNRSQSQNLCPIFILSLVANQLI